MASTPQAKKTDSPTALGVLRALASSVLSRSKLATAAGLTFAGKRDLYEALGYPRTITSEDYRERFKRNPVASRVVTAYPSATWRGGGEIIEDEDPDIITPFEDDFEQFAKRLRLWSVLQRADTLAGIGRYAIILIGAPGKLEEELPRGTSLNEIAYLSAFAEYDAKIHLFEKDPANPRYGLPTAYAVSRITSANDGATTAPTGVSRGRTEVVHWTRVIHVADNLLDDEVYGTPRLESIWNRLDDLEKVTGGGAEAFWLRAHQGYQFDLDKDLELDPEDEDALNDEVDEFQHGLRRTVRTRGVKINALGSDVANFNPPVEALIGLISAGTGIPKRILMGSERGELASTQDKHSWDQRVADRRKEFAEPYVVNPLIGRLMDYGYLEPVEDYQVRWPQQQDLNDVEKADLGKKWAGINKDMGDVVVTPNEIRDRVLGLGPLDEAVDPDELERMRKAYGTSEEEEPEEGDGNGAPVPGADPDDEAEDDDKEDDDIDLTAAVGARARRRRPAKRRPAAVGIFDVYRSEKRRG